MTDHHVSPHSVVSTYHSPNLNTVTHITPNKPLRVDYTSWNIRRIYYQHLSFLYNRKNPHGKCLSELEIKFQDSIFFIGGDAYQNSPVPIFGLIDSYIEHITLSTNLLLLHSPSNG
jgi:hypothetical protein